MPAVPNEAFGVFLSSSPPSISAAAFAGCFLWDGAGLQPLASRRAARSRLSSGRFVAQGDSRESDVLGGWSAAGDRDGSKFDCDGIFSRSVASPSASSLLPAPCGQPRLAKSTGNRLKKRVTFADHMGFDLEAVKVIQEEPDSPPPGLCYSPTATTAPSLRSQLPSFSSAGATELKLVPTQRQPLFSGFRADFPQPVSDYAAFKARLQARCLSLENVTVDALPPYLVSITVKVKNVSFEKHVFVRATRNGWKSHRDFAAAYHSSSCSNGATSDCFGSGSSAAGGACGAALSSSSKMAETSPYDTFLLRADLAGSLDAAGPVSPVEFAVCFRAAGGVEYWDNNDGANYRLLAAAADYGPAAGDRNCTVGCLEQDTGAATAAGSGSSESAAARDTWTSFAVWRTTSPEVPYW